MRRRSRRSIVVARCALVIAIASACGDTESGQVDQVDATGADRAVIRLLDPLTGDERWSAPLPGGWSTSPVTVEDRVVVQVADNCRDGLDTTMMALDLSSGTTVWKKRSATGCETEGLLPLVSSAGAVVVDDGLRGFDVSTGEQRWSRPDESTDLLTAVADAVLYVGHSGGAQLLDPATGELGWSSAEVTGEAALGGGNGLLASLALQAGPVFQLRVVDVGGGQTEWTAEVPFLERITPPVVGRDVIVLSMSDGFAGDPMDAAGELGAEVNAVVALAARDGRELWRHEYRAPMAGVGLRPAAVAVDADRVYELRSGVLEAFAATDGTSVWVTAFESPADQTGELEIVGDTLLAVHDFGVVAPYDARLVAVDAATGVELWTLDLGVNAWTVRLSTAGDRVVLVTLGSWTAPRH